MKVYEHADTVIDVFDHYDNGNSVKAMALALHASKDDGTGPMG